jgi:hypothetical protein
MKKTLILIISLVVISCKEDKKIVKNDKISNSKINIIFSDTVYIYKEYYGEIDYKNHLDTITTSFDDIKNNRYIYYSYTKNAHTNYSYDSLKKTIKDTFGARNNRLIPLYNIRFDKLGVNYIDGIITDEVMIENGAKNDKGEPMTRIITNEFRVSKRVIVIDRHQKKE